MERERVRDPAPRRRATVSRAMAVSARRALWRTGFPCCRVGASAQRTALVFYFARPSTGATSHGLPHALRRRLGTCILASGDLGAASSRWGVRRQVL